MPGAFLVVGVAPPSLSLRFEGKLRDRVGKGTALTAPDGALDGTFRVTVEAGSGARTVTQLELWRLVGSSRWDTIPSTFQWVVAAAGGLDSPLHNAANGSVSFATGEGQSFYLFAPDPSPSAFTAGSQFRLLARFADGSSATADATVVAAPSISAVSPQQGVRGQTLSVTVTGSNFQAGASVGFGAGTSVTATTVGSATSLTATVVIATDATLGARDVTVSNPDGRSATLTAGFTVVGVAPPSLSLRFEGKLRDRVGKGTALTAPDGALDGTFRVTVEAGSGARTVTQLELWRLVGSSRWDTIPSTFQWVVGCCRRA